LNVFLKKARLIYSIIFLESNFEQKKQRCWIRIFGKELLN
jgi:hypothetical protein